MHTIPSRLTLAAMATLALGCAGATPTEAPDHASLRAGASGGGNSVAAAGLAQAVTAATSRYHSTTQATKAGYLQDTHCVASPAGGMGYHWANPPLIDPVFDPFQPEVVLYEADAQGNLKLVAVEYVVVNVGQPAPTFGGQPFDVGGAPPLEQQNIPHWTLHVWLHKTNPSGLFAKFNPTVTCPAP
jgi:hypothetical protein